jgi:hypothetical protein
VKTVYMTLPDYENYLNDGFEMYYDSPQQLFDYEGNVEFIEVTIYNINLN